MVTDPGPRRLLLVFALLAGVAPAQDGGEARAVALASLDLVADRGFVVEGEWVRGSVAFGRSQDVRDPATLGLRTADGRRVPARLRALSRWGAPPNSNAPIRWLEVVFAAPAPGASPRLEVFRGPPVAADALRVTETAERVELRTPTTTLTLRRGGVELIESLAFGDLVSCSAASGRLLAEIDGDEEAVPSPWELVVEDPGPVAATVVGRCRVAGLRFEARFHLVAGARQVVVDLRVVNPGPYGHGDTETAHVYLRRLGITLPRPAGLTAFAAAGVRLEGDALESPVALLQQHRVERGDQRTLETFPWELWAAARRRASGERAEGVQVLEAGEGALLLGVERFWESGPRAVALVENELVLDLFPAGGTGPAYEGRWGGPGSRDPDPRSLVAYRFEGARAKTTRVVLEGARAASGGDPSLRLAERLEHPLRTLPAAEDLVSSGALGHAFVPEAAERDPAAARFERVVALFGRDAVADDQPELGGRIGLPAFLERGGTYGRQSGRGWFDDGDVPWGDGFCSLHYDLPFGVLLGALRRRDAALLDRGAVMSAHRRDIDQDHDTTSDHLQRGGQFYEKGHWHGNFGPPALSHTWLRGPILHWWLTGDEGSREAAELGRAFIRRSGIASWSGRYGARVPGWSLDNLVALWDAFGDPEDLRLAGAVLARFEEIEAGRGIVYNVAAKPPGAQPWNHCILFNAAARYVRAGGPRDVVPLLRRLRGVLVERALVLEGPGAPFAYRVLFPDERREPSKHLLWPLAASLALSAEVLDEPADLVLARRIFRAAADAQDGSLPTVAFRVTRYPGSESKILANIALWGAAALPAFSGSAATGR